MHAVLLTLTVAVRTRVCIVVMRQEEMIRADVKLSSVFSHFLALLHCCLKCENTL